MLMLFWDQEHHILLSVVAARVNQSSRVETVLIIDTEFRIFSIAVTLTSEELTSNYKYYDQV